MCFRADEEQKYKLNCRTERKSAEQSRHKARREVAKGTGGAVGCRSGYAILLFNFTTGL